MAAVGPAAFRAQADAAPLFLEAAVPEGARLMVVGAVSRGRAVRLDERQLALTPSGGLTALGPRRALRLNLFDDVSLIADLERVEAAAPEGYTWVGRVRDEPLSQVLFVVQAAGVTGHIAAGEAAYEIRLLRDGVHAVYQIDPAAFPPELEPIRVRLPASVAGEPTLAADDGSQIDVLVAYTPAALAAVGGAAQMQGLISLAVAETNAAYANSQVAQRLRLVHAAEMSGYVESGNFNTELARLQAPGDGHLDNVHALRNTYGADMVSLLVNNTQYCGLAYLMTVVSPSFAPWAFSVVYHGCATGYYSFAHELGHNLGSDHDRANGSGGAYPYSFGYQHPGASFRTIMAYNCPGGCPRIQYFSNPNVSFGGQATGVDYLAPNSADNARSLNNTAFTAANWRAAIGTPTATATLPASATPTRTPMPTPSATPTPTNTPPWVGKPPHSLYLPVVVK